MLIVVSVTAVVGFSVYLKRRSKSLENFNSKQFADVLPPRSLFAPTDEEIRAFERAEKAEILAEENEKMRLLAVMKIEKAKDFQNNWRVSPDKSKTIELLKIASEAADAEKFSEIAENVIQVWRENRINNLNAADLAVLLDSHLKTLPQQERTSGALFWLKEEIKNLRKESE